MDKTVENPDNEVPKFVDIDRQSLGIAAIIGVATGVLVWLISWFLQHVIFNPLICHTSVATCGGHGNVAFNIAAILAAVAGVAALARSGIYRPVLVALATIVSLWSLQSLLGDLGWLEALAWTALLYGLSYALFAWAAKIYNLTIAGILLVVLIILARIAISA